MENAKNSTTSIIGKLAKYAEKLCKKKFKKDGFKGTIKDQDVGTDSIGWGWFSVKRDRVFSPLDVTMVLKKAHVHIPQLK